MQEITAPRKRPKNFRDITSQVFTHLTALHVLEQPGAAKWRCRCSCGKELDVLSSSLLNGNSASCGCLRDAQARERMTTHGGHKTSTYRIWGAMQARCGNPKFKHYHNYGGRGIRVCERWKKKFEHFLADMGPRPSKIHSIDRINVDGNYEPVNCRWATKVEQENNRRDNHLLTFQGKTQTLTQWSQELGVPHDRLRSRKRMGWSDERALTEPIRHRGWEKRRGRLTPAEEVIPNPSLPPWPTSALPQTPF